MLLGDGQQLGLGGGPAVAPLPEYPDQPPGTTLIWTAGGSVTMMREPLPDALVFALDARRIAGELKPYVDGPKDDSLPDLDTLFRDALVAHETVALSLDVAEGPELVASDSEPPRDLAEVRATLESWSVVLGLHVLYVAQAQASGRSPSGHVDVAFRVLPSGNVADCRVVSTTLTPKELVDGVCRLVSAVRFDEEQVAELEVRSFSVAFAPALSPAEEERARELPL
jgi:hypothetical protein